MVNDKKEEKKCKEFENNKEILAGVLNQINSFDNKANVLITVIGIIFGLSLTFLERYETLKDLECIRITFKIFYLLYVISSLASITASIIVILPRTNKKQKKNNVNYYMDLCEMKYDDFKINCNDFFNKNEVFFNQIQTNARICKRKHKWLRISIFCMIPTAIFLIILLIISVCFIK